MSKRTILWAVMLLVAFASGFGVGASLWKYSAADKLKELFGQREALQMVLSNQLDGWPVNSGEMIGEVRQSSSLVKSSDRLKPHPAIDLRPDQSTWRLGRVDSRNAR